MKLAIIGAGIAGLAAAVRSASAGHKVDVFEANSYPGGKLSMFEQEGYRFDAGPSLFTMPQYVEDLFRAAGEDMAPHFHYQRLPVLCNYFWEDGTQLSASGNSADFAGEVERVLGVPADKVLAYLDDSKRKYRLSGRIFLEKSLHKAETWLNAKALAAMWHIPRLDLFSTMNAVNERYGRHPKLVQLFNRYATYNGSNPYKTPGLLTIIPHFEYGIGAFYPEGGMYRITEALWKLGARKGARYHFSAPVEEIRVENGRANGLRVNGQWRDYDCIISNMDAWYTYRKLLLREPAPERALRQEKSTSALIFYWGIRRQFPELDLHNIFFSEDYRHEFDCLSAGAVSADPTVYINITSKYTPADAPEGCENWFTMVNVPYNNGQDWDALIAETRRNVLAKISRILGTPVEPLIATESLLDPRSIESKTSSHLGALYGTSSNTRLAAFLRHPNFSHRIKSLYFCGGSVHPGGGIPLALLSGKIASEIAQADLAKAGR